MSQLQKIAWVNLAFYPLLVAVIVLSRLGMLSERVQFILLCLLLAAVIGTTILMAKMPWQKGAVEDERDRLFRQRSFVAGYIAVLGCLSIGLVASVVVFPDGTIPMHFVAGWIGGSGIVSVLAASVAILIQYRLSR